ncbi:MAG: dihydrodipicolinate synthase family protein [Rhodospirillaceae bacterium]|nr:dihydrodipicolinate synthase family protein [Rhodospirillaceae bacterium]MYK15337.1 dihydrodipicolinate synthase family protein [Rhodospirillaceae bacterium]MYK57817.1 dihydrodipicolinate synthase family protein [Rhodospirillaceae bacterium]
MARTVTDIPDAALARFRKGTAIPAHPLALTAARALDETRQRALSRYYIDAGAGGLAVGVHTTQFAIREAGLYEPVLRLAAETATDRADGPPFLIAGVTGRTGQAVAEAQVAAGLGYHAVLLSLAAFRSASEDELIAHCRRIGEEMPVVGFYLQPAVGGVPLPCSFWRRFAELDTVVGIKIAPFDRYGTLDVVRGVAEAGAEDRIALYTGNDDNILLDLLTPWRLKRGDETVELRIAGGLLGHWSVWVKSVVTLLDRAHAAADAGLVDRDLLALAGQITDCNAAFFDVANDFRGCIAGMHEVLRRQGLLEGIWCLDPDETLSPGQAAEIDRVCRAYPHLNDDSFVAENLERWLAP